MAALVQKLEAENKQLRMQLMDMERLRLIVADQYEDVIKKISDEHQEEKQQLEEQLTQNLQEQVVSSRHNESDCDIERLSKATQTAELVPSKVDEVRRALRLLSDHCVALDQSLENAQEEAKMEKDKEAMLNDKVRTLHEKIVLKFLQNFLAHNVPYNPTEKSIMILSNLWSRKFTCGDSVVGDYDNEKLKR